MELSDLAMYVQRDPQTGHRTALVPVQYEDGKYSLERRRINLWEYETLKGLWYHREGIQTAVYIRRERPLR